jgi:hypothetical protein
MRRGALVVSAIVLVTATACGGGKSGPSTDAFAGQLDDICRPIKSDLANLGIPSDLAGIGTVATKASRLIEDGLNEIKALTIPTSNKTFQNDANDFISTLGKEVDRLDQIAADAASGDVDTATTDIGKFERLASTANDIANDLGASRCKFDPIFDSGGIPVDTLPPDTLPPDTLPPETLPPETAPPNVTVPPTGDNKVVEDLAAQLTPAGDYQFVNTSPDLLQTFRDFLAAVPVMDAQPGTIGAVDVFTGSVTFARVFAFAADGTLDPASATDFVNFVSNGQPLRAATFGAVSGAQFTTTDGLEMFVGNGGNVLLWGVATNPTDLQAGVTDLLDSITG